MATRHSLRLFVWNIPWTVSRKELREYFNNFGILKHASVVFNNQTGMHKGYGFVEFRNNEGYNAAISQENHTLENHKLTLRATEQRTPGRRRPQNEDNTKMDS